MKSSVNY